MSSRDRKKKSMSLPEKKNDVTHHDAIVKSQLERTNAQLDCGSSKNSNVVSHADIYQYFDKVKGDEWRAETIRAVTGDQMCDYSAVIQRFISNQMTVSLSFHIISFKPLMQVSS